MTIISDWIIQETVSGYVIIRVQGSRSLLFCSKAESPIEHGCVVFHIAEMSWS